MGKRGEEEVNIQLHCKRCKIRTEDKYSPKKCDSQGRQKSLAAIGACAIRMTMVHCGSQKSTGVSSGSK